MLVYLEFPPAALLRRSRYTAKIAAPPDKRTADTEFHKNSDIPCKRERDAV